MSHDPYQRNTFSQVGKQLLNTASNYAKHALLRGAKSLAKLLIKKILATKVAALMGAIIVKTSPVWVPILLILAAYMIIYAIPREIVESGTADKITLVAAFLGVTENDPILERKENLFDDYQEISAQWSEGLTEEQISQASAHTFPWSVLIATDRIVNDTSVWEGTENINLQPHEVFEALRPVFGWKESTVTIVTVTCEEVEVWVDNDDDNGDDDSDDSDNGNDDSDDDSDDSDDDDGGYYVTQIVCTETTEIQEIVLLTSAYTIEGHFEYIYEWQTDNEPTDELGSSVTTTKEVLKEVMSPDEYSRPWKDYLADRGLIDESCVELIMEIAMLYDEEYRFNHALLMSLNYDNYPSITASNGWLWPTPSNRITSPYGPRSSPRVGFHYGVDVGATTRGRDGDPIWSIDDGTVQYAGYAGGYGNIVIISHSENVSSYYAHLQRRLVSTGNIVTIGDPIGTMGNTGYSTNTHLHFEIRVNNDPLNPMFYFDF